MDRIRRTTGDSTVEGLSPIKTGIVRTRRKVARGTSVPSAKVLNFRCTTWGMIRIRRAPTAIITRCQHEAPKVDLDVIPILSCIGFCLSLLPLFPLDQLLISRLAFSNPISHGRLNSQCSQLHSTLMGNHLQLESLDICR
ncbi:hypothetical protein F511_17155 [Dorcoceras hygrometricum]|uniref:Uncharacterized protein n=1 Tax=Dorcoceras hygrometricum TaxID=472368 RepID=A0A2Z7ARM9_9LAMI|nr:hypothetical protein F511_17155 [Dorcoceras hygrometricum]